VKKNNPKTKIFHKFKAKPTNIDGLHFASKKEANYYQKLKIAQQSGELLFFLTQVPFRLPGGVKYLADFMEFWKDGEVKIVDVKGRRLPQYIAKKKQIEALYPIEIIET
jgi:hypothetical protein